MSDYRMSILLKNSIPEPMSGCWLWTGTLFWDGYGQFNYVVDGKWKKARAHRISYELHKGQFDSRLSILHRCDMPSCVNPDHLFCGTHAENMQDKVQKGRAPHIGYKGEKHPGAKLSNDDILRIREDVRKCSEIAKDYGVGWNAIKDVKSGRRWGHI